jgi:hypothetical protein
MDPEGSGEAQRGRHGVTAWAFNSDQLAVALEAWLRAYRPESEQLRDIVRDEVTAFLHSEQAAKLRIESRIAADAPR